MLPINDCEPSYRSHVSLWGADYVPTISRGFLEAIVEGLHFFPAQMVKLSRLGILSLIIVRNHYSWVV